jgi:RNA-directed DNA polymerase
LLTCSREKWVKIPPGKSLFSAPTGKGLPIGNLTSQFLANVYLNPLDQFIKHGLKAKYYIRYVDDMILVHEDRHVLETWRDNIEDFLHNRLLLEIHPKRRIIRPVSNGADFVGYVVRPSHLLVRRRIVDRCKAAIARHSRNVFRKEAKNVVLSFPPDVYQQLYMTIQSYFGLFKHASSTRLCDSLFARRPWIGLIFQRRGARISKRWAFPGKPANLKTQYGYFRRRFRGVILFQVGKYFELFDRDAIWAKAQLGMKRIHARPRFYARCGVHRLRCGTIVKRLTTAQRNILVVAQNDMPRGHLKDRIGVSLVLKHRSPKGGSESH